MPSYKLYYFPFRTRAEPIRILFTVAGVEYEDIHITLEDWPNHKQKMPFRQMPVLDVDGKQLSQSYAILRYLANEFGLAGKTKWEVAEADQFMGAVGDLFEAADLVFFAKDEADKTEKVKKVRDDTAPSVLQALETVLGKNSSGYLVGDELTYADIFLITSQDFMDDVLKEESKNILSAYPNIQKHREKIRSLPKIAAWIKNRPENDF